jgi:8-oxo-dGTP pyrophosphatase MutT (NUDIX family)
MNGSEGERSAERSSANDEKAGYPRRHATEEPNRFLIPTGELPPGFAQHVGSTTEDPVQPRPAATVVLARDSAGDPEILLLRRHGRSGFAADSWVFPGGLVDTSDRDPAVSVLCDGPSPAEWATALGLEEADLAMAYPIAAVREAFEETGILLARKSVTRGDPGDAPLAAGTVDEHRDALLAERTSLREIAAAEGITIALDRLVYVAHWITPEPEPRRYDTRFFLAAVPDDARCVPHEAELVEHRWVAAQAAVAAFETGTMSMLPPTVDTLRRLSGFTSVDRMVEDLGSATVRMILPRMRAVPDGVVIEFDPEPSASDAPPTPQRGDP